MFYPGVRGGRVNSIIILIIFLITPAYISYAQTTLTYTSSGTFVPPAGVTSVSVVCRGGGGAGGGANAATNKYSGNGGGGGGCSTNNSLTVTAGTSYTITVGAGGIGGVGINGGNGGSSSFGSLLTAGGGGGGYANSATGGGAGGTGTCNGGNGHNTLNNNNLPGGGGGGGGGTTVNGVSATSQTGGAGGSVGGGAGGNGGYSGNTIYGDGLPGTIPGGGGGGGGSEHGRNSRSGGDGARGEVTVTFTCSSYNIWSTWVNGSSCPGSQATVYMSAVIPVGTYTVTYNLSGSNTATGNTATMVVTSSGSGSFLTSSLANSGTTTVTITRLGSGSGNGVDPLCYSDISANNIVNITVIPTPYITLGANPSVCEHTTTALLPYTDRDAEYYSIDFDAAANSAGFSDFTGWGLPASSPIAINVPYGAPIGTYNGTLTVGKNTPPCVGNSYPITVTISGTPPVSPTTAASDRNNFCSDDAGNISLSV